LVGTHFERVDMSCGDRIRPCLNSPQGSGVNPNNIVNPTNAGYQFRRNRILLREWDIWYFIAPRMSTGLSVLWYDASNLGANANQAAHNLGICKSPPCRTGVGGDWVDVSLTWRYQF
jgi:hypothetical protein